MKDKLAEIEARCAGATDGPWEWQGDYLQSHSWEDGLSSVLPTESDEGPSRLICFKEDMDFIAHARQDIPALLKAIRILSEALEFYVGEQGADRPWDEVGYSLEEYKSRWECFDGGDFGAQACFDWDGNIQDNPWGVATQALEQATQVLEER